MLKYFTVNFLVLGFFLRFWKTRLNEGSQTAKEKRQNYNVLFYNAPLIFLYKLF